MGLGPRVGSGYKKTRSEPDPLPFLPDAPKEGTGSVSGDSVSFAEGSKDPEISPAQPSLGEIEDKSQA